MIRTILCMVRNNEIDEEQAICVYENIHKCRDKARELLEFIFDCFNRGSLVIHFPDDKGDMQPEELEYRNLILDKLKELF